MHKKWKIMIGCGIACILALLISSWYAVTYNDARLVVPMDFDAYVFQAKDLPMILSVLSACAYGWTLLVMLLLYLVKRWKQQKTTNMTRKLSPKMGILGLLGFLGFFGFWTYSVDGTLFPFIFFQFFGFFGFFYEGKMSGTFMDERFRENAVRAQLKASKITCLIVFIALLVLCQKKILGSLEYTFITLVIVLSLALALGIFLSEYLLYRYDHDDQMGECEE